MHRQVRRFTTAASSALHPPLKRFAFSFSYHGSFYNGFPTQKDDDQESPLYTTLHRRLSLALDAFVASPNPNHTEPRRWENLTVSSRTDAGVHALRNTAHVDLPPNLDCPSKIVKGLNYHLPLTSPFSNPRRGLKVSYYESIPYRTPVNEGEENVLVLRTRPGRRQCPQEAGQVL